MITIENEALRLALDPRGAAMAELLFKPLDRVLTPIADDRNASHHYHGTIVGPVANRISGAQFTIADEVFILDANEGPNTLHGGNRGLSEMIWDLAEVTDQMARFTITLADRHMGFPGPSTFAATYSLRGSEFELALSSQSPRLNAFNLAPHFYFNLAGSGAINNHQLQVNGTRYLPVDHARIPTTEIASVADTKFDFRSARAIDDSALDHNFCIDGVGMREVLVLASDDLTMTVISNQPGLQIYDGRHIKRRHLAIEPQGWPNAVNTPSFQTESNPFCRSYHQLSRFDFAALGRSDASLGVKSPLFDHNPVT